MGPKPTEQCDDENNDSNENEGGQQEHEGSCATSMPRPSRTPRPTRTMGASPTVMCTPMSGGGGDINQSDDGGGGSSHCNPFGGGGDQGGDSFGAFTFPYRELVGIFASAGFHK
jgi:hypothetical protein